MKGRTPAVLPLLAKIKILDQHRERVRYLPTVYGLSKLMSIGFEWSSGSMACVTSLARESPKLSNF